MMQQPKLKRTLSLPMLLLYGLGATIGAGIYVLIGEIAGIAGYYAPVSFLLASLMSGFTAASYAELSARLPFAAGSALYVREGTGSRRLSLLVGLLVITAGLVSSAALLNGFVAYLNQFITLDRNVAILLFALLLGGIAAWGIAESVAMAGLVTLIEIGGLVLVIAVQPRMRRRPCPIAGTNWSRPSTSPAGAASTPARCFPSTLSSASKTWSWSLRKCAMSSAGCRSRSC